MVMIISKRGTATSKTEDNYDGNDRKINSCSKFAIKLFPATVANAKCSSFTSMYMSKYLSNSVWRDLRLPMSLHTFLKIFCTTCYSEIKTNSFEPNYTNFELFEKNKTKQNKQTNKQKTKTKQKTKHFLKTIFDKALTPFWKTLL